MRQELIYRLVESLLEQANIDIERDMWHWTDDSEDDDITCSPSEEVTDGLTAALSLFFDTLSEQAQQEVIESIHKFAYKPTLDQLLVWQGTSVTYLPNGEGAIYATTTRP